MTKPGLKIGVIGFGIGEQHLLAYSKHPQCQVIALCDLSEEKLQIAQHKYPGLQVTTHCQELFANPNLDAISIASYDDDHFEQTIAALKGQKHVFVEKPLCRSLEELQQIQQTWAHQSRLVLNSNLVLRAAPLYLWLKEQIQKGVLGDIYAIDGDYLYGRLHKITEGWRKEVKDYSVMQGGGVHLVDLMLWLTGQRPDTVTASGNRICTAQTDFRYSDYVCGTFNFTSGLVGRITANFGCVHRHQHVLRVFGTAGTFIYDDLGPRLHTSRDPALSAAPLRLEPLPRTKGDLIPHFVDAILSHSDTTALTQGHFDVISACVAVDQSLAAQTSVEIQYV